MSEVARHEPRPAAFVAIDVVLLTVIDGQIYVLLYRRDKDPWRGRWALPGVFMRPRIDGTLVDAAERALMEKAGVYPVDIKFRQLGVWHRPGRDPRGWVISVAYYAFISHARFIELFDASSTDSSALLSVQEFSEGIGAEVGRVLTAFDHKEIVQGVLEAVRTGNDVVDIALESLAAEFSLKELQTAIEAISGRRVNKDSFRRSIVQQQKRVVAIDKWQTEVDHRPAQLYVRSEAVG